MRLIKPASKWSKICRRPPDGSYGGPDRSGQHHNLLPVVKPPQPPSLHRWQFLPGGEAAVQRGELIRNAGHVLGKEIRFNPFSKINYRNIPRVIRLYRIL